MESVQIRREGDFLPTAKEEPGCAGQEFNASSAKWSLLHTDNTHPLRGESEWRKPYLS